MQKTDVLKKRSAMLSACRAFFLERNICEVDVPHLSRTAIVDTYIDLVPATFARKTPCYLLPSPEAGMKKLLAAGLGDCYQLAHVFRDAEVGIHHQPEFMMAEWYRVGFTFRQMIDETFAFMQLFLGPVKTEVLTYADAFKCVGIDIFSATPSSLRADIKRLGIHYETWMDEESKDNLLDIILSFKIQPKLGLEGLCALTHYPASQCAMAQVIEGELVAERFEIFYKGVELCNGYHELQDSQLQEQRFEEENAKRVAIGKEPIRYDRALLKVLKDMPDCCGVAVGFDRLLMLQLGLTHIGQGVPSAWEN